MNEFLEVEYLIQLSQRIDKLRQVYNTASHYEKFFIMKEAKKLKIGLNRSIGQFKRKMKKKYYFDDFIVLVITSVF